MGNTQSSSEPAVNIPPVEVFNVEKSDEKRDRVLRHLLRLNHHSHSVLYSNLRFHNHLPHLLGSAYILGASDTQLSTLYDTESTTLEPWEHSPHEVSEDDWRNYLGDKRFQRAYLDFFEDEMARYWNGYDWKKVMMHYLLEGDEPLINGLIGGLGHPLIHVGYAIELDNREVAMEALTLAATSYNNLHKYIDEDVKHPPELPGNATTSVLEILNRVGEDNRFDGFLENPGADNINKVLEEKEEVLLEYFHQLEIKDPNTTLFELTKVATILFCATHKPNDPQFDFFIVHLVTTSYAMRTILPILPAEHHIPLLKSHWLFILLVYIIQMRPVIRISLIEDYKLEEGKNDNWEYVVNKAIAKDNEEARDAHYVKALRALKDNAKLFEQDNEFYLKAAVMLADKFRHWIGFSESDKHLDIRK